MSSMGACAPTRSNQDNGRSTAGRASLDRARRPTVLADVRHFRFTALALVLSWLLGGRRWRIAPPAGHQANAGGLDLIGVNSAEDLWRQDNPSRTGGRSSSVQSSVPGAAEEPDSPLHSSRLQCVRRRRAARTRQHPVRERAGQAAGGGAVWFALPNILPFATLSSTVPDGGRKAARAADYSPS